MTSTERKKFTVITNQEFSKENETEQNVKRRGYQTNPLQEKFLKFVNNEAGRRFSIEDLLR